MPASGHALTVKYGFGGLPGVLLGMAYLLSIVTGFYGFFYAPPTSVSAVVGFSVISIVWNLAFIFAGGIGLFARKSKAPRTEIVAVETISAVMVVWAFLTFLGPQSNQAGLALLTISLLFFGWAAGTRAYLNRKHKEIQSLRRE